jgi:hypothetical protein
MRTLRQKCTKTASGIGVCILTDSEKFYFPSFPRTEWCLSIDRREPKFVDASTKLADLGSRLRGNDELLDVPKFLNQA